MEKLSTWMNDYVTKQREVYAQLPLDQVATVVGLLKSALDGDKQVFVSATAGARPMRRTSPSI